MATSSNRSLARLEFAVRRAEESGDMYAWMIGVHSLYYYAQKGGASDAELAELRESLREHAESLRAQFRSRVGRLWTAQIIEATFAAVFTDELSQESVDLDRIFQMIEAVKARMLLDQMSLGFKQLAENQGQRETSALEQQMLAFEEDEDQDAVRSEIRLISRLPVVDRSQEKDKTALLTKIEQNYKSSDCGFAGAQSVAHLADVQAALGPREALIEYFVRAYRLHPAFDLYILVITAEQTKLIPVPLMDLPTTGMTGSISVDGRQPLDSSALGELVFEARTATQNGNDDRADARLELLHQKLIQPVLDAGFQPLDFDRWIIVPHSMLHPVPWIALKDPHGRRLIQDVALTFVPSASIWLRLLTPKFSSPATFLGFGNPTLPYAAVPDLPEAEQELKDIVPCLKNLETTTFTKGLATETALRQRVAGKSIVHLATHGAFPEQDPLNFHQVLLSPTRLHDGRVNAEELRDLDFHSAQLVVLSICNGGIYRFGPGDEPYGIISGLLTAGAQNLIGTLWSIEDAKGRSFMVDFYTHLLECGPAEALRRTACKLITDGAALRDWAAFLVAGPGRSFQ